MEQDITVPITITQNQLNIIIIWAFKRLEPEDFVVSARSVTSTCWTNNAPALNIFTSSIKQGLQEILLTVYQTAS